MFKRFFLILSLIAGFCCGGLFANLNESELQYVTHEQVLLTPDGIFILVDGECMPIRSLTYSGEGYYCFPTS